MPRSRRVASPIIVGIDFAEPSLAAARWAKRHLAAKGGLVVAHSVWVPAPPPFLKGLLPSPARLVDDVRDATLARLQELADELGPGVDAAVEVGRPHETLLRLADERKARLLVVGAHGERSGVWRLLGSTAERVVRNSRRPVLLARNLPSEGIRKVLVAVDDAGLNPPLVDWVKITSRQRGSHVVVFHVVSPMLAGFIKVAGSRSETAAAESQLRRHTKEWLRENVEKSGLDAEVDVALGDARFELLRAADRHGADVLVIGSHDPVRGMFMGSTAEFVLRQGSGPVLVVPPAPAEGSGRKRG